MPGVDVSTPAPRGRTLVLAHAEARFHGRHLKCVDGLVGAMCSMRRRIAGVAVTAENFVSRRGVAARIFYEIKS